MTISMERRNCEYKQFDTKHVGFCLLVTGGMTSQIVAVIERLDGTVTIVPVTDVQFLDIAPWNKIE
jgi:hypothetical protein